MADVDTDIRRLQVANLPPADSGRGIARVPRSIMDALGLQDGDVLAEVLLEHRAPATPVVVGRDIGRDGEDLAVTTLGDLDPDSIDMRCLLIVGSSRTVATPSGVWTSRRGD